MQFTNLSDDNFPALIELTRPLAEAALAKTASTATQLGEPDFYADSDAAGDGMYVCIRWPMKSEEGTWVASAVYRVRPTAWEVLEEGTGPQR